MNQLDFSELECISGGTQLSGTFYVSIHGIPDTCVSEYLSSKFQAETNDFEALFYEMESFCIANGLIDPKLKNDDRYYIAHYNTIRSELI